MPAAGGVTGRVPPAGCMGICRAAHLLEDEVVLVLEGEARRGLRAGGEGRVRTVHAERSGDDAIVDEVMRQAAVGDGRGVVVVTADRVLRDRVEAVDASSRSPG